ncbi:hypothetical protein BRM49_04855, partial [Xanthomonas oryzae pv. oryzae]
VTCRTASILNAPVYRLLLMDISEFPIFHGLEMSMKAGRINTVHNRLLPRRRTLPSLEKLRSKLV